MIPLGATSLNDVVTDLDLTTANANLNDGYIRNRVGKYSGAISIDDLRGSFTSTQDTMDTNWNQTPSRYQNGKRYYDPLGNESSSEARMVTNGDASQGIYLYAQHGSQGGGDFSVTSVHVNTIPAGMSGWIRMSGTLECSFFPNADGGMQTEVILWDGGDYYTGTPQYLLAEDWSDRYADLSTYPMQFLPSPSVRHVTITHQAIIKSSAPDLDYTSGNLYNFTARITAT